ncbi:hypothetical protein QU810_18875 [Klebsiella pneumoniae]|nr:hypothetical protein [Klebsiella pneumoniae]MDM9245100.1 hypothetical protein [Klebsiella pneumoniae]
MLAFLNQVRKPTLDLPLDVRRKMWFKPFMQSYCSAAIFFTLKSN